jgi:tartrate dehydratase beta subunit/fumarate hydratase class I family protein
MTILPFLKDSAFGPEDIKAMSAALEDVCDTLKINGDMMAREVVAVRIIELTRRGERNPAKLRERLLVEANGGSGR